MPTSFCISLLQLVLDRVRRLGAAAIERRERAPDRVVGFARGGFGLGRARPQTSRRIHRRDARTPAGRTASCRPAGWRRASPAAHSPAAKRPGHGRHLRIAVDADAAHDVVRGRPDLHRRRRDVDVGQLHELVVHRRQLLPDVLRCVRQLFLDPGDVEVDAAVRASAPLAHLLLDAARHVVTGEQLRRPARRLVALT